MKRLLDSYLFSFFDTLITLVKLYLNLLVKRRDLQRYRSFMLSFLSRNGFTTNRKGFLTIGSCLILYIKNTPQVHCKNAQVCLWIRLIKNFSVCLFCSYEYGNKQCKIFHALFNLLTSIRGIYKDSQKIK